MISRTGATTLLAFLGALLLPAASPGAPAPTFSDPTTITNPWTPFVPGAVKMFRGKSEGVATAMLELHRDDTRVFSWNGQQIETRILEEREFEHGVLTEIAANYLAQDDAGNVYAFGEVSLILESGLVVGAEEDSWLVGGPGAGDPVSVFAATDPMLFMPAQLQLGDSFALQPIPGWNETITVVATDLSLKVSAGKFTGAVRLQEIDDGEDTTSTRWLAPGVGTVKEKEKGAQSQLLASSLVHAD